MHINKIVFLVSLACLLILFAPVTTLGVSVPPLQSHSQAAWKNAWEDAWKVAWESAWKFVYTSSVPAEAVQSAETSLWDSTSVFEDDMAVLSLDVIWGAPLPNSLEMPDALALALDSEEAGQPEYGKLYIQVTPPDAQITLRGQDRPFTQGMVLEPGSYIVDIRQSGYLVQTRRIELRSGMAANLDVSLTPEAPEELAAEASDLPEAATQTQLFKTLVAPESSDAPQQTAEVAALADASGQSAAAPMQSDASGAVGKRGSLFVSTEPADAKVRILHIKPVFHQGIQLSPGRYTIDAASEGFERYVANVDIVPDQETRIHLSLEQQQPAAKLFVRTEPAGATVRILNIKPVFHQGIELKHGEYLLDAQLDGFKTATHTVTLAPGEERNITLNLLKASPPGKLYVEATPPEAKIRILNIRPKFAQGLKLEEGEYTIDAQLDGYRTEVRKVHIVPGEETRVSLQLDKAGDTGRLFVETEPAGAMIRILDIKPRFEQGMELAQGEYTIDAQLDGYRTEIRKVSVTPGQTNKIRLTLAKAPEKGKLFVTTEPGEARVRILHIKPVFHQGIELVPGSYTIDAQLDGHDTVIEQITIEPRRETHIALTLAQTRHAAPVVPEPALDLSVEQIQPPAENESTPSGLPQKDVAGYDVEAFVSMAVLAINAGNYQDALNASNHALALDADCAEALKIKGDVYLLQEEYGNAISEYDKAINLSEDQQIRINRSYAYEQLKQEIKQLKAAKRVKPGKGSQHHQFALDN